MTKIDRKYLITDFGQMHLRLAGDRYSKTSPLICLHMAPQSGQDFAALMKRVSQDRLVIAPDYHGYGSSDPISGPAKISISVYAKSIWQALDQLDVADVEILGHHTGSKVGIEMALQSPERVRKLLCISLSTMTPEQYAAKKPSFKPLAEDFPGEGLWEWWKTLREYYDPNISFKTLSAKYAESIKTGEYFHSAFKASHEYNADILNKLGNLKTPVALVNPNDDLRDVTPIAAKYITHCHLVEKPDWKPGFLDTKPNEVFDLLQSAFKALDKKLKNSVASYP